MTTPRDMLEALKYNKRKLTDLYGVADDPEQERVIGQELQKLEQKINRVVHLGLGGAAILVAEAADELMEVVRSVKTGALDGYIQDVGKGIARLRVQVEKTVSGTTQEERDFPKTENPETDPVLKAPASDPEPGTAAPIEPPPPVTPPAAALPDVVRSNKFADLKAEYQAEWNHCRINDNKRAEIEDYYISRLNKHRPRYEAAVAGYPGMPWYFIGVIHSLESNFSFVRHLHNGDPLSGRTIRVPRGRPDQGSPPFGWEYSAADALAYKRYHRVTDWSLPHILYLLEGYNGFGYRYKRLRTPYLWSYSNLYTRGRYVADHVFDANSVCQQCGAATMLKALLEGGIQ